MPDNFGQYRTLSCYLLSSETPHDEQQISDSEDGSVDVDHSRYIYSSCSAKLHQTL